MINIRKKNFKKIDLKLILTVITLIIIGLVTLKSASLTLDFYPLKSQLIATFAGLMTIGGFLVINYDFIKRQYMKIYIICIVLMIAVNLFGTGAEEWGSNNWLDLKIIKFQPSEFVKLGLIISIARILEINQNRINEPKTFIKLAFLALLPVALIAKEDFGTAAATTVILAFMFFTAGLSRWYYFGALGLAAILAPLSYPFLQDYQKERILDFFNPKRDISGSGFQTNQGKIAIGSGMLLGRGLFKGVQTQNNFIPEKHTDFIFPVLAEETGFIGVVILICLYLFMMLRFIQIARNSRDSYGSIMTMGVCGMFFAHIAENIGMTLGLMPVTGIPLPFMSHGGTFQLINLMAIGLVLSVSVERQKLDFN